ncbi:MAG: aminomethyl-transferring glycine dehydrogenase subunit GcvPA [Candidatus Bathyarchaeota archaeon]|nr:aminomethyl-transferring glycine dehydrogenase subunit GcvPA [Candidatus Bathyarchaeota archaeon]MDH5494304.1 aminomethyl-transferring glycine dehydrogenase subunit GcvPA [Candidatus Bathyarchaeota archaeon]
MVESYTHPYIPNSKPEIKRAMMKEIGIENINALYKDVPERFMLKHRLNLPCPISEYEVKRHVESLLARNKTSQDMPVFLGAGCWPHYVPAVVENIIQRTELLTSYTPYQPEISQGMLQLLFEYQSMICELTGMDVANSSLYDWASALGEAARMAMRLTGRREVLVPKIIHPERYATLATYIEPAGMHVRKVDYEKATGQLCLEDLKAKISDKTAAVYIENPSYLGFIETRGEEAAKIAHEHGALFVVGVDPTSLGILKPPGDYGAEIVIGEGQPLGNPMNFGGPLLGVFACRGDMSVIRQMPGRIIGMTTTQDGSSKGFCMVLQTREQHIRRQKATSNVCTNESLCAAASAVYLALLGPNGLKELGEAIMLKSHYTMKRLSEIEGVRTPVFQSCHFQEFTVNFVNRRVGEVHERLSKRNVHGGKDISKEFPELGETALYCVTEVHSKTDIDGLADGLEEILWRGES